MLEINQPILVNKKELIQLFPAFTKNNLAWWIRNRKIPMIKIGRKIFFDVKDVNDWVNENKIKEIKQCLDDVSITDPENFFTMMNYGVIYYKMEDMKNPKKNLKKF